jgi:hypothetical protein
MNKGIAKKIYANGKPLEIGDNYEIKKEVLIKRVAIRHVPSIMLEQRPVYKLFQNGELIIETPWFHQEIVMIAGEPVMVMRLGETQSD